MLNSSSLLSSLTGSSGGVRSANAPTTTSMTPNTGATKVTNVGGTPISRPMGSVNTANTNLMNESSLLSNNNLQNRQLIGQFDSNMMQMSGKLDKMSSSVVNAINRQTALISQVGGGITNALSALPGAVGGAVGNYVSQALEQFGKNFNDMFQERANLIAAQQNELLERYGGKFIATVEDYQEHFFSTFYKKQVSDFQKIWRELPTFKTLGNEIIKSIVSSNALKDFFGIRDTTPSKSITAAVFTQDYKEALFTMANKAVEFYAYQTQKTEEIAESLSFLEYSHQGNVTDLRNMMEYFLKNNSETKKQLEKDDTENIKKFTTELQTLIGNRHAAITYTDKEQLTVDDFYTQLLKRLETAKVVDKKTNKVIGYEGLEKYFGNATPLELGNIESWIRAYSIQNEKNLKKFDELMQKKKETQQKKLDARRDGIISFLTTQNKLINTNTDAGLIDQLFVQAENDINSITKDTLQAVIPVITDSQAQSLESLFKSYAKKFQGNQTNLQQTEQALTKKLFANPLNDLQSKIATLPQVKPILQEGSTNEFMMESLLKVYNDKYDVADNKKAFKLSKEDIQKIIPSADDKLATLLNRRLRKYREELDKENPKPSDMITGLSKVTKKGKDGEKEPTGLKKIFGGFAEWSKNAAKMSRTEKRKAELQQDMIKYLDANAKALKENTKSQDSNTEEIKTMGVKDLAKMGLKTLLSPAAWIDTLIPFASKILKYTFLWTAGNKILDFGRIGINKVRDSSVGRFAYTKMWMPAKVHIIDPLLSGIGALLEKIIGKERMQKIKDAASKLVEITGNAWNSLFGSTSEIRAEARSKIVTPMVDALTGFFYNTVVPFLFKTGVMYFGARKLIRTTKSVLNGEANLGEIYGNWKSGVKDSWDTFRNSDPIKALANHSKSGMRKIAEFARPVTSKIAYAGQVTKDFFTGGGGVVSKVVKESIGKVTDFGKMIGSMFTGMGPMFKGLFGLFGKLVPVIGPLSMLITGINWLNKQAFGNDTNGKKNFSYYVGKMTGFIYNMFLGLGKSILGVFKPSNILAVGKVFIGGIFGIVGGIFKGLGSLIVDVVKATFTIPWTFGGWLVDTFGWIAKKIKGIFVTSDEEKRATELANAEFAKVKEATALITSSAVDKAIAEVSGKDSDVKDKLKDIFTKSAFLKESNIRYLAGVMSQETLERLSKGDSSAYESLSKDVSGLMERLSNRETQLVDTKFTDYQQEAYEKGTQLISEIEKLIKSGDFEKYGKYIQQVLKLSGVEKAIAVNSVSSSAEERMYLASKYGKKILYNERAYTQAKEKEAEAIAKKVSQDLLGNETIQGLKQKEEEARKKAEEERKARWDKAFGLSGEASLGGIIDYMNSGEFAKTMGEFGNKIGETINKVFNFFKDQNWGGMIGSVTQSLGALTGGLIGGLFGKDDASKFFVKAKKIADDAGLKLMSRFFEAGNDSILGKLESLDANVQSIKEKGTGQQVSDNGSSNVANGNNTPQAGSNPSISGNYGGGSVDFDTSKFQNRTANDAERVGIINDVVKNLQQNNIHYGATRLYGGGLRRFNAGALFKWDAQNNKWNLGGKTAVGNSGYFNTLDCSQFVAYMQSQLGNNSFVYRNGSAMNARDIYEQMRKSGIQPRASLNDAQPGDIIFQLVTSETWNHYNRRSIETGLPHHIGMITLGKNGELQIAHATGSGNRFGGGVKTESLSNYINRKKGIDSFVIYPSPASTPLQPVDGSIPLNMSSSATPAVSIGTQPQVQYGTGLGGDIDVNAISNARTRDTYLKQKGHFDYFTKKYSNVSSALAVSVMEQESHGNVNAHNKSSGAHGLFQLMDQTAQGLGVNRYNVGENIGGGIKYLHQQIKTFGNVPDALMAYNWGPGYVKAWIRNGRRLPFTIRLRNGRTRVITKIPDETVKYVSDIMGRLKRYSKPGTLSSSTPTNILSTEQAASTVRTVLSDVSRKQFISADAVPKFEETVQGQFNKAKWVYENNRTYDIDRVMSPYEYKYNKEEQAKVDKAYTSIKDLIMSGDKFVSEEEKLRASERLADRFIREPLLLFRKTRRDEFLKRLKEYGVSEENVSSIKDIVNKHFGTDVFNMADKYANEPNHEVDPEALKEKQKKYNNSKSMLKELIMSGNNFENAEKSSAWLTKYILDNPKSLATKASREHLLGRLKKFGISDETIASIKDVINRHYGYDVFSQVDKKEETAPITSTPKLELNKAKLEPVQDVFSTNALEGVKGIGSDLSIKAEPVKSEKEPTSILKVDKQEIAPTKLSVDKTKLKAKQDAFNTSAFAGIKGVGSDLSIKAPQIKTDKETAPIESTPDLKIDSTTLEPVQDVFSAGALSGVKGVGEGLSISAKFKPDVDLLSTTLPGRIQKIFNQIGGANNDRASALANRMGTATKIKYLLDNVITREGTREDKFMWLMKQNLPDLKQEDNVKLMSALNTEYGENIFDIAKLENKDKVSAHLPAVSGGVAATAAPKENIVDESVAEATKNKARAESIAEAINMDKTNTKLDSMIDKLEEILTAITSGLNMSKLMTGLQISNMYTTNNTSFGSNVSNVNAKAEKTATTNRETERSFNYAFNAGSE